MMSDPTATAPAGWYPDPNDPARNIYWNGVSWSVPGTAPRGRRRWLLPALIGGGAGIVALVLVLVFVVFSSSGDSLTGYNQNPVAWAKKAKICDAPEAVGTSGQTAKCTLADGAAVALSTSDGETEQSLLVAQLKDNDPGWCFVVLKGVVLGAPDESTVTEAVGIPEAFATKHGGYTLCPI